MTRTMLRLVMCAVILVAGIVGSAGAAAASPGEPLQKEDGKDRGDCNTACEFTTATETYGGGTGFGSSGGSGGGGVSASLCKSVSHCDE